MKQTQRPPVTTPFPKQLLIAAPEGTGKPLTVTFRVAEGERVTSKPPKRLAFLKTMDGRAAVSVALMMVVAPAVKRFTESPLTVILLTCAVCDSETRMSPSIALTSSMLTFPTDPRVRVMARFA